MRKIITATAAIGSQRELAVEFGFASDGRFLRAFQTRFGVAPLKFREMVVSQDTAWLSQQAERAGFTSLQSWLDALGAGNADWYRPSNRAEARR